MLGGFSLGSLFLFLFLFLEFELELGMTEAESSRARDCARSACRRCLRVDVLEVGDEEREDDNEDGSVSNPDCFENCSVV